jgi:hypothetical protein
LSKNKYNFTNWPTKHLTTLLPDYEETLETVRKMQGANHPETQMYTSWVKAMKEELALREMQKRK